MGKIKSVIIAAAAIACPIMASGEGNIGQAVRAASYISAGVIPSAGTAESSGKNEVILPDISMGAPYDAHYLPINESPTEQSETITEQFINGTFETEPSDIGSVPEEQPTGTLITRGASDVTDGLDLTAPGNNSGAIIRRHYGASESPDTVTLSSGAQLRNMSSISNEELLESAESLPGFRLEKGNGEPQVLIVHTHTTESYEPYSRDYYDEDFPSRTRDCSRNMVAVGDALSVRLAELGVSVLHDCTEHDYPTYTGSYDRSEATIRAALEEYPSIKVVIDLHRDAIEEADGSRIAPTAETDGKTAAQFMIIAGCDDGRFNMPNYMENLRFACLLQNTSEMLYPGLARPVLFDYRNYNQHLTTGSLLIEVGGHANSFEEAEYTGELLGEIMAAALEKISE
ncbi:MAG: stage II sporulation protein P [Oscillospiraceae bacterium]|nr:stage II sporulation protein P [Oscillospiraceae bacterium]